MLATEDLEIRGAGELLGEQQSGSMQAIGYSLYMEMLEKATKAIQKGKTPNFDAPLSLTAEINLHMPALIPDDYLGMYISVCCSINVSVIPIPKTNSTISVWS